MNVEEELEKLKIEIADLKEDIEHSWNCHKCIKRTRVYEMIPK
jgi:hypothetical protein